MAIARMRSKKGDQVRVLPGKDLGKEGEITRVLPERNMVIVDGVNVAKKHQRPRTADDAGRHHRQGHAAHASNVAIVCPTLRTRAGSATASTTTARSSASARSAGRTSDGDRPRRSRA